MLGMKTTITDHTGKVAKAEEKVRYRNFSHAAASIRKDVQSTIVKADGPSTEGAPPHTHKRVFLRRGIRFAANKEGAVIGPAASIVGTVGAAHEFGAVYKGVDYPDRPFMRPGLERNTERFAGEWRGSIGE